MEDFYTELMFIGYTLLILLYIQKAYVVPEVNSSLLKLFGVALSVCGYLYLIYDAYNAQNKKQDNEEDCRRENKFEPAMGRVLLTVYGFLSFIIPISVGVSFTDIYGIFGNMLLINKYDNYHIIAYSLLTIHYSIITTDIVKQQPHLVLRGIAGLCLVLYLTKKLLKYYQDYVKKDKKL